MQFTADERVYDAALLRFLDDLARRIRTSPPGLGRRMDLPHMRPSLRAGRLARGMLDRAGPALPEDVRDRLSRIASQPAPQTPTMLS